MASTHQQQRATTVPYLLMRQKLDKNQCRERMRQGELADKVEIKYGAHNLAKFAKAVGKPTCTVERQRSVYRAWDGMGITAPGPVSYSVLRE
jgi:hypothetical protein